MRFLALSLAMVGLVLSCGDGDRAVAPAGKVSTDCSLADILAGNCADTEDPSLDEVPEGYEAPEPAPADSTESESAGTDSTETEGTVVDTVAAVTDSTGAEGGDTFDIEVVFLPPSGGSRDFTDHEKKVVLKAARRWEEKFTRGIPDVYVDDYHAGRSLEYEPGTPPITLPAVVDDIIIYVTSWRDPDYWGWATIIGDFLPKLDVINTHPAGLVRLDVESISEWIDEYYNVDEFPSIYRVQLEDVAAHEIGHVLQGPQWHDFMRDLDGPFPYFAGSNAVAQFRFLLREGGLEYSGVMVPTSFSGGGWNHWFDSPINTDTGYYKSFAFWNARNADRAWSSEIMNQWTGGYGGAHSPISRVTLGALSDLGYPVDMSEAEYYRFARWDDRRGSPSPKPVVAPLRCGVGLLSHSQH